MKWVKHDEQVRLPIKSWCENVEENAMKQAVDLANHPCMVKHVALMPDCHMGYGMPIGGVIACEGAVIPNAVGVDIGCGMIAVQTDHPAEITDEQLKTIMGGIRELVPVGFKHQKEEQEWVGFDDAPDIPIVQYELDSARKQMGTLGGGNHFIEIQSGDDGKLWFMVHSGSRNIGFKIAKKYHEIAVELCERWKSDIPDKELSFLPLGLDLATEYLGAMEFALAFAKENRERIMYKVLSAALEIFNFTVKEPNTNIHHNYAAMENHFGKNVMIHRKGATRAREGEFGIIPGSMGTASYIVKGKGNPGSFQSCSHGAGRCMGRKEASRTLTEEECDKAMDGIVFGRWGKDRKGNIDLGEAPQAYKNIDEVMESQSDLVEIVTKLTPLGVIKG